MHVRLLFIITLCSLTHSSLTHAMIASPIKKLNQLQRYMCVLSCFDSFDLKPAPYNVSQFLKQIAHELNCTHIKMPTIREIDTLNSENKNLMLAYVMDSAAKKSDFTTDINSQIPMAIAYLINAGANPNTIINYWHDSPALILAYEAHFYSLRIALELNNIDFIDFLLTQGANVHGPQYNGAFFAEPIFYAQTIEAAKILFKHGLNLDSKDHDYSRVIESAIHDNKSLELIELYLKHGAPIAPDILHTLADCTHPDLLHITKFLIKIAPHTINTGDVNYGSTPLDTCQGLLSILKRNQAITKARKTSMEPGELERLTKTQKFIALLKKNGAKTKQELKNLE